MSGTHWPASLVRSVSIKFRETSQKKKRRRVREMLRGSQHLLLSLDTKMQALEVTERWCPHPHTQEAEVGR